MKVVHIKPMSINGQYQGRRFLTPQGKKFKEDCSLLICKHAIPDGHLRIDFEFGLSNKLQDVDGPIKSCMDILQKKLDFNDNKVYEVTARKIIVKKGQEYWSYHITKSGL